MNANTMELKKKLPHGAMKSIATKTGLSLSTISQVIRGNVVSTKQSEILKATAEFMTEYKAKEREAVRALNEALNPGTEQAI